MTAAPPLSHALGEALRSLRDEFGVSADEMARAARVVGLPWTRSVVAALENGRRQLDAGELLALPLVVRLALPDLEPPLELADLLAMLPDQVALSTEARVTRTLAVNLALGEAHPVAATDLDAPRTREHARARAELRDLLADYRRRLAPHLPMYRMARAHEASGDEAVRKAARTLNVDPLTVSVLAERQWRRSLTAERDARVTGRVTGQPSPRALQAIRGHITRELLTELVPAVQEVN